jgi:hypothetical protein
MGQKPALADARCLKFVFIRMISNFVHPNDLMTIISEEKEERKRKKNKKPTRSMRRSGVEFLKYIELNS